MKEDNKAGQKAESAELSQQGPDQEKAQTHAKPAPGLRQQLVSKILAQDAVLLKRLGR